jgi:glyoxylase-like metal-dependent hydrolase (beta-lactamase superfamily II)
MIPTEMFKRTGKAALVAGFVLAGMASMPSQAAAPMAKVPAPGYFRMMLGDFEITALNDGTVGLQPEKILSNTTPEKVAAALAGAHMASPVETSVNAFLVNTGSKLVMIDSGAGAMFGATLGKLVSILKASGYQPEQIDEIYITHMHGDHVGGLVANGQPVFANAVIRADKAEADYWLSQDNLDKAPDNMKGGFKSAQAALGPYVAAGRFKPIDGAAELVPGIAAQPSKGHTPGHDSYVVTSKGQKLVLIGDLIHVAAVQFPEPAVTISFDKDSKAAAAERDRQFTDAAKQGYLLGAAHLSFPGIGYVHANGGAYSWQPVNFTQMNN